jgi:hypothetical protein
MRTKSKFIFAATLIAASGAAIAQAPPAPATPPQQTAPPPVQHSTDCMPTQPNQRGSVAPEGQTTGQAQEPLGDRLAKSDGVLCPPGNVDPEMRAPAPEIGKTPIIPPPGSPGGDPSVRPK